jgi:hypothetical protein
MIWPSPAPPRTAEAGCSYYAAGEVYELRAIHPISVDLSFVGQTRSAWATVSNFKDHFVLLPPDIGGNQ